MKEEIKEIEEDSEKKEETEEDNKLPDWSIEVPLEIKRGEK